jgi:hypothetical protein
VALETTEASTLRGSDVVLFFDKASKFALKDRALVTLEDPQDGV